MGVQHRGKTTPKDASKLLREFWPRNIVREVEVKRRVEIAEKSPEHQALWIIVTLRSDQYLA